jgi:hypothetical protein
MYSKLQTIFRWVRIAGKKLSDMGVAGPMLIVHVADPVV